VPASRRSCPFYTAGWSDARHTRWAWRTAR